jgi:hypothetical protein
MTNLLHLSKDDQTKGIRMWGFFLKEQSTQGAKRIVSSIVF